MNEPVAFAVYVPEGKLWRLSVVTDGSLWIENVIQQAYKKAGIPTFWKWIYYPTEAQPIVDKAFLLRD